jgi:hypothetical protein
MKLTGENNDDIYVRFGSTIDRAIDVKKKADGTPYDFTDHTAVLEVYTSETDKTPNLIFNAADGILGTAGKITLSKSNSIWTPSMRRRSLIYFLWVTDAAGNKELWLNGKWIVEDGVSSRQNASTILEVNLSAEVLTLEVTIGSTIINNIGGDGFVTQDIPADVAIKGGSTNFNNGQSVFFGGSDISGERLKNFEVYTRYFQQYRTLSEDGSMAQFAMGGANGLAEIRSDEIRLRDHYSLGQTEFTLIPDEIKLFSSTDGGTHNSSLIFKAGSLLLDMHTGNVNSQALFAFISNNDDTGGYSKLDSSVERISLQHSYGPGTFIGLELGPCNGAALPGIIVTGLPTSSVGLMSGALWRDVGAGNVIKMVP